MTLPPPLDVDRGNPEKFEGALHFDLFSGVAGGKSYQDGVDE